ACATASRYRCVCFTNLFFPTIKRLINHSLNIRRKIPMASSLFTSESVSEGHPDKIADQISDAVLDALLEQDPKARVACETLIKTGMVVGAGEVTTGACVDSEDIASQVGCGIGYDRADKGFYGHSSAGLNASGKQSPRIAMGVDDSADHGQRAGHQGRMFGYATNETGVLMP